jgi:tRNA threonylcarbamoyladenosine biosynthesis protein TsaE
MSNLLFTAADEQATARLGAALSHALPDGATVGLVGTLGAGKTRLVQAIAEAEGIDPRDVVSPTFVLIHEYQGRRPIFHFDAYRLKDDDEFLALGPEEYFSSQGLSFVEWADRVESCLPRERLDIHIEVVSPTARRFEIAAHGDRYQAVVDQLHSILAG